MDGIWFRLRLPAPPCSALPPQTGENPMIDLYFWPTGNGKKTVILLEELGMPYTIKPINIGRGDQLAPEFLKISPNGRMPAIVDDEPMGGGDPISILESGPIMMYLAEKTGKFYPQDPRSKYDVAQWVGWQLANQGPKLGEQGRPMMWRRSHVAHGRRLARKSERSLRNGSRLLAMCAIAIVP